MTGAGARGGKVVTGVTGPTGDTAALPADRNIGSATTGSRKFSVLVTAVCMQCIYI